MSVDDRMYMEMALAEAKLAVGGTAPNPPVGAVVVKDGRVVARGHTAPAGGPHAEVVALRAAGDAARGATLYTTLEPCSHQGRTGPCTDVILAKGVSRVVVGSWDRNPRVSRRGIKKLRRAGVTVDTGILETVCDRHNSAFFTWVRKGRPYVILKAAASLDGRIATRTGDSRWITGKAARAVSHEWRHACDAILVGAGTVRTDDPRLTARVPGGARDPVRVILDGNLTTDPGAKVYRVRSDAPTWLVVPKRTKDARLKRYLKGSKTEVVKVPGRGGRVDLPALLATLAERNVMSLLVEGGAEIHGAFIESGLVDEIRLFLAPKLLGEGPVWLGMRKGKGPATLADTVSLGWTDIEPYGDDVLLTAYIR